MKTSLRAGLCFSWLLAACTVHVFSPPAGNVPMESSRPLGPGKHALRGDIAGGGSVWGPPLTTYRLTVVRGVTEQLDMSLAPSLTWLHPQQAGNPHPGIYTLRTGAKYAPSPFVAFSGGVAPGGSAGGGLLAHDAGLILAGENPYLVPILSAYGLLSVPVARRRVRIVSGDDVDSSDLDSDPDVSFRTPRFTYGYQMAGGLKLPLFFESPPPWCGPLSCAWPVSPSCTR